MKPFLRILCITFFCFGSLAESGAQTCAAGTNQVTLNWDYRDFFTFNGFYTTTNGYLSSNAQARNQTFAFGTQRVSVVHNWADDASLGDNGLHTGEAGSNGTGDDVQFVGDGVITFTFDNPVQNVRFSLYDVDYNQSVRVTATNGATPQPITTLSRVSGTLLTIAGSGTTSASATAAATYVANTFTDGTVNVNIAGPITSFTITVTASAAISEKVKGVTTVYEDGSFWLSDITACSAGNFATDYHNVSKPFTGQPGYVLHSFDKSVYAVNPANGLTKLLFTDAAGAGNINSMAYDPVRRILYYVYSLTSTGNSKALMKYDFNTETISTVLSDITSSTLGVGVGIPVVNGNGVESGAASFYDGSLYLGIETSNDARTSAREAVIWKIDFNASNVPYRASQAFALPIDNGDGLLTHDWSDFVISNGTLYNFDGAQAKGPPIVYEHDIYHYNMLTGAATSYHNPSGFTPGQPAVDWTGKVYNLQGSNVSGFPSVNPYIALYNGDGTISSTQKFNLFSTPMFTPAIPSLGDAAEAFKPKADFGDAPATYDPDPLSPALHELNPNLKFGNNLKTEWDKLSTTNTDDDDDGLDFVPILNQGGGVYQTYVKVFNNTGANAIVAGWMDFNKDGKFDENEGVTTTVGSNASMQSVSLYWTGITQNLPNNSNTNLRIRITSATNAMSKATPTGYFSDGEVEDWYVLVNTSTLAVDLKNFTAQKTNTKEAKLNWTVANEEGTTLYELERSSDGVKWNTIYTKKATGKAAQANYTHTDVSPNSGINYYRIKYYTNGGVFRYSGIQHLNFSASSTVSLYPNPATTQATLQVDVAKVETAQLYIVDVNGKAVASQLLQLKKGLNSFDLPVFSLTGGVYYVQVFMAEQKLIQKLIIQKK